MRGSVLRMEFGDFSKIGVDSIFPLFTLKVLKPRTKSHIVRLENARMYRRNLGLFAALWSPGCDIISIITAFANSLHLTSISSASNSVPTKSRFRKLILLLKNDITEIDEQVSSTC